MGIQILGTYKSRSEHSFSKCKWHTLIFSSAGNFSRPNFCIHAIFNVSSDGSQYKLTFSSLEVIELFLQATTARITLVKIIFTKSYCKTISKKLCFQKKKETILLSLKMLSFVRKLLGLIN